MKFAQKATVQGRSFFFNFLFVLLNFTGLALVVIGSHKNFESLYTLFSFIGWTLIMLSSFALFLFHGRLMIANISRTLVGGLFIVSGLVKANDPIGFSYKLEEYFEDGAIAYRIKELLDMPSFSLEYFIQHALLLSVLICIAEIVLGVLLIIGGKIKLVSYLTLLMMLFFTFLTWHTANCDASKKFVDRDTYLISNPLAAVKLSEAKTNKEIKIVSKTNREIVVDEMKQPQCVSDCGCFGDAMKGSIGRSLTPQESFWKDIVLVYLTLWIFIAQWIIEPNTKGQNLKFISASIAIIAAFSWVFGWLFPIFFGILSLLGAVWILRAGGKYFGNYFGSTLVVSILCVCMTTYVLMYEPLKDYRPYAENSNLLKKMNDGVEGKYESMLVYVNIKTGAKKEFSSTSKAYIDSKIWEDKNWKYDSMIQKEIIPSRIPSITNQFNPFLAVSDLTPIEQQMDIVKTQIAQSKVKGLNVYDVAHKTVLTIPFNDYSNYPPKEYPVIKSVELDDPTFTEINLRDYFVSAKQLVVLIAKNLKEANWNEINRYKSIASWCKDANIPFFMITNSNRQQINYFRKKYNFNIPVFLNDETELKAIARSNPSLMVLQQGVVKGKFPHRSTPTFDWLRRNTLTN